MSEEVKKIIDQLQERIDMANQKAESIIHEAEEKARKIVANAGADAAKTLQTADQEAERRQKAHQEKLRQAVRDTIIELKDKTIQSILNKTFSNALHKSLNDAQIIEKTILTMGKEFASKLNVDLKVLLGSELFDQLGTVLKQKAHETIKTGLQIEMDSGMKGGFKIGPAKEGYVYDFSEESLLELFSTAYGSEIEAQFFAGDK
jgi:V/A-type H+-transporting ATPase subunit E